MRYFYFLNVFCLSCKYALCCHNVTFCELPSAIFFPFTEYGRKEGFKIAQPNLGTMNSEIRQLNIYGAHFKICITPYRAIYRTQEVYSSAIFYECECTQWMMYTFIRNLLFHCRHLTKRYNEKLHILLTIEKNITFPLPNQLTNYQDMSFLQFPDFFFFPPGLTIMSEA